MLTESKNSFILYKDYEKYFSQLEMNERGLLITAIFDYQINGTVPESLSPAAFMAFSFMRDQFERDLEKYRKRVEKNRSNGHLGGRPKKTEGFSE